MCKVTRLLPFASGGAAGRGGSTPTLCSHLPLDQGETLCGHTLPGGEETKERLNTVCSDGQVTGDGSGK